MNTYTKLRSGDWGVRTDAKVKPGDVVTVTKKSGETKEERIGAVLSSGTYYCICSTAQNGKQRSSYSNGSLRGRRTGCRCGSIEGQPRDSDCRQCQYDNE